MEMHVNAAGALSVVDENNFKKFHVSTQCSALEETARALEAVGSVDASGHAWIDPDKLKVISGRAADTQWVSEFDAMVGYARSKGWLSPEGAIRAHIEGLEG